MTKTKTELDYSKITDVEINGIDSNDYPEFADAYIASADYDGRPMTDEELDDLNNDSEFVYEQVNKHLY
jgi:hypothetical protein